MSDVPTKSVARAAAATNRRHPTQYRSLRTVARILDAARSLLTQISLEELTTTRIAIQAGLSVGALYRFFPDRESIIDEINASHIRELRALVEREVLRPMMKQLWRRDGFDPAVVLPPMIDSYVVYLDTDADFRTISFGRQKKDLSKQRGPEARTGLLAIVATLLFQYLALVLNPELDLRMRVTSEAGERLIAYAYEQPTREQRDVILAQAKKMLPPYMFPKN